MEMTRNRFKNIVQNYINYDVNKYLLLDIQWNPLNLLVNWYRDSFQALKRPGREVDPIITI
jgi:hypothetical protein